MKKAIIITVGILGILIGTAFVMPAFAQYKHVGAMDLAEKCLLLLGLALTAAGLSAALLGIKKRRA